MYVYISIYHEKLGKATVLLLPLSRRIERDLPLTHACCVAVVVVVVAVVVVGGGGGVRVAVGVVVVVVGVVVGGGGVVGVVVVSPVLLQCVGFICLYLCD